MAAVIISWMLIRIKAYILHGFIKCPGEYRPFQYN